MKFKYIFKSIALYLCLFSGFIYTSCADDIEIGNVSEDSYSTAKDVYVALKNFNDPRPLHNIELRKDNTIEVFLQVSKLLNEPIKGKLSIDPSIVEKYNKATNNNFEIYPTDLLSFEKDGEIVINKENKSSEPTKINISYDKSLIGKTFMLPIKVSDIKEEIKFSNNENHYIFIVKVMDKIPDSTKDSGIATIIYFEVNDCNPLNAKEYTLKNSQKPFADIVTLFAANINYNNETGRVYVSLNENISHILENRDKYIKPLQDMGIKVHLSILGNHDAAGVANLAPATCKDFARELKTLVDAYGLDGIDFDDEYSKYDVMPGLTPPSSNSYARLCYETKKIMPDKKVIVYHIGNVGFNEDIFDEDLDQFVKPGDFIDYTLEAYYASPDWNLYSTYKGMTPKQNAPYSRKINKGLTPLTLNPQYEEYQKILELNGGWGWNPYPKYIGNCDPDIFNELRERGYGANMLYNMDPINDYIAGFNTIAETLYDDQIQFTGVTYDKDW